MASFGAQLYLAFSERCDRPITENGDDGKNRERDQELDERESRALSSHHRGEGWPK